jgi:hypothetical protein
VADLISLRHMVRQMSGSMMARERHLAGLLAVAVMGIARPVLIHRR